MRGCGKAPPGVFPDVTLHGLRVVFAFTRLSLSRADDEHEEGKYKKGRGANGKNEANGGECGFLPRGESSELSVAANEPNVPIFDVRDLLPRVSVAPVVSAVVPVFFLDVAPVAHARAFVSCLWYHMLALLSWRALACFCFSLMVSRIASRVLVGACSLACAVRLTVWLATLTSVKREPSRRRKAL